MKKKLESRLNENARKESARKEDKRKAEQNYIEQRGKEDFQKVFHVLTIRRGSLLNSDRESYIVRSWMPAKVKHNMYTHP